MKNFLSYIFLASCFGLALTSDFPVKATGCITCQNQPMRYVKIYLMDEDPVTDETMATGRAGGDGCFTISGKGSDSFDPKPEPYIKVEYQYTGSSGQMEVEGLVLGENHKGKSPVKPYAANINFGVINFDSFNCKTYTVFYDAMENFRNRVGTRLPVDVLHIRTGVLINGGSAYTTTDVTRLPSSYTIDRLTNEMAQHELAHAVRHTLDGDLTHFLWDVTRFFYLRNHDCGLKSNVGYAFNEGWALFWENYCHGTYGATPTDYEYEGNVAKALRLLKSRCGSNDWRFVEVLRKNKGGIHSFSEFNAAHGKLFGCKI